MSNDGKLTHNRLVSIVLCKTIRKFAYDIRIKYNTRIIQMFECIQNTKVIKVFLLVNS